VFEVVVFGGSSPSRIAGGMLNAADLKRAVVGCFCRRDSVLKILSVGAMT
jgi:hypothetical protein